MTVQLRSDRHPLFGPGFALLVFDRPIDAPRLDISILNIVTGLYLGPSLPGRPNWVKQRTTFFPAIRAGGEGSSIFRVGPEVTTYVQEGTYVEIASIDGSVCDELSWEGVLVRSSPAGTEDWTSRAEAFELRPDEPAAGNASQQFASDDLEKIRRDEREADRRRQQEEERLGAEQAPTAAALAERQAAEEERRRAEKAAAVQRAREETIRRELQEESRLRAEQAAAAALGQQPAERRDHEAPEDDPQPRPRRLARGVMVLAMLATVVTAGYQFYQTCGGIDLFCSGPQTDGNPSPLDAWREGPQTPTPPPNVSARPQEIQPPRPEAQPPKPETQPPRQEARLPSSGSSAEPLSNDGTIRDCIRITNTDKDQYLLGSKCSFPIAFTIEWTDYSHRRRSGRGRLAGASDFTNLYSYGDPPTISGSR